MTNEEDKEGTRLVQEESRKPKLVPDDSNQSDSRLCASVSVEQHCQETNPLSGSAHALLHNIRLTTSCAVKWDEMKGDDWCRTCDGCKFNVYKLVDAPADTLSALIGKQQQSRKGRSQLYRRADGTYMLNDCVWRNYPNRSGAISIFFLALCPGALMCVVSPGYLMPLLNALDAQLILAALILWNFLGCLLFAKTRLFPCIVIILVFAMPLVVFGVLEPAVDLIYPPPQPKAI